MDEYIAPYLPPEAVAQVKGWAAAKKIAVQRIVARRNGSECENCQDVGVVYVSFLGRGPTRTPITIKKPSTYVEADGQVRAGWYVIDHTLGYECPHCHGRKRMPVTPPMDEGEVLPEAEELARQMEIPSTRRDLE